MELLHAGAFSWTEPDCAIDDLQRVELLVGMLIDFDDVDGTADFAGEDFILQNFPGLLVELPVWLAGIG